jgi:hypothetical protein
MEYSISTSIYTIILEVGMVCHFDIKHSEDPNCSSPKKHPSNDVRINIGFTRPTWALTRIARHVVWLALAVSTIVF